MGTYGLVRFVVPVVPEGMRLVAPWLGALAVVGIIWGSLACLVQTDLKRLVAYSSVGHMGFVLLGIATLTPAGINGALYANIAHGLITGLLFFLVGAVKDRHGTADLATLGGGLYARAPRLGAIVAFAAIASLGLPGLAGFWGEALAVLGALQPGRRARPAAVRRVRCRGGGRHRAHRRLPARGHPPRLPGRLRAALAAERARGRPRGRTRDRRTGGRGAGLGPGRGPRARPRAVAAAAAGDHRPVRTRPAGFVRDRRA